METLENFFSAFPERIFSKDEIIVAATSPLTHLYFIESGVVKVRSTSTEGQQLMLHLFHRGASFPLLGLINNHTNEYDCVALNEVKTRVAPVEQVTHFLQTHPEASFDLNQRLLQGLNGLLHRIQQMTFMPAYQQVAGVLLYFAKHFGETQTEGQLLRVHLTHQDIAEWLGLSRENVSIQMKQLERDGLIRKVEGLTEILNVSALEKLARLN